MGAYLPALVLFGIGVASIGAVRGVAGWASERRRPVATAAFLSGASPREHAVSRFHPRWYPVTLLFLAFDMEMVFMYPWAVVVADLGAKAVVEMFAFLALLFVGVLYAWREGALRWT